MKWLLFMLNLVLRDWPGNMIRSQNDVCVRETEGSSLLWLLSVFCRLSEVQRRNSADNSQKPPRQQASPRSRCSPEYNLLLVHKGNKGEMFNSCSVGQDKCNHCCSDNLQTRRRKAPGLPRPNNIYYLVKNTLYNMCTYP